MRIEDYDKYGIVLFGDEQYVLVGTADEDGETRAVRVGEICDKDGNYACDSIRLDPENPKRVMAVAPREFDRGCFFNPTTEEEGEWLA